MNSFKTDNLYIGLLGVVSGDIYSKLTITSIKKCIIYQKVEINKGDYISKDYGAKDIFTDKIYYFFQGNHYPRDTIAKAIGGYAIMKSFPIEQCLDSPKKTVSESELLDIFNRINYPEKEKLKEEPTEPITDSILKTILETSDLVKASNIDNDYKKKLIKELEILAEDYIKDLEEFNNKNKNNSFQNVYQIRMAYIKKLVDIEERINNPKYIKSFSLKRQLNQFKKELNSND